MIFTIRTTHGDVYEADFGDSGSALEDYGLLKNTLERGQLIGCTQKARGNVYLDKLQQQDMLVAFNYRTVTAIETTES